MFKSREQRIARRRLRLIGQQRKRLAGGQFEAIWGTHGAVATLEALGDSEAMDILFEYLSAHCVEYTDPGFPTHTDLFHARQRGLAVRKLGALRDPRATRPLLEAYMGRTPRLEREHFYRSTYRPGSSGTPGPHVGDKESEVQSGALSALAQLPNRGEVVDYLLSRFNRPGSWSEWTLALRGLDELGDRRGLEAVAERFRGMLEAEPSYTLGEIMTDERTTAASDHPYWYRDVERMATVLTKHGLLPSDVADRLRSLRPKL